MNYEEAKNICTEFMQFCKEEAYEYRAGAHDNPLDYDRCMQKAEKTSRLAEALMIILEHC